MATLQQIQSIFPTLEAVPEAYRIEPPLEQREYLVNGQLRIWLGNMNPIESPVCIVEDGQPSRYFIGSTPMLTSKESLEALDAAVRAYDLGRGYWPMLTNDARINYMRRFVEEMKEVREEVVKLLMLEIGKSLKDSEKEFDRTVSYIIDTINELIRLDRDSDKVVYEQGIMAQIRRVPLGVTLCMGPYNYPLNETFSTLIPALIMGNTVVFKPAKYGVLLIRPFLKIFREVFPPGVINVIYGSGRATVGALMESGKIDAFAFIGTNEGANQLKKMHPKAHRLRAVLGLDAKNVAIVLPDADLKTAVSECLTGSLSFNGQRCTALKMLIVHESVVQPFLEALSEEVSKLGIGMPWDPNVALTPLPEPDKCQYLTDIVEDAKAHGAQVVNENGGTVNATFFYPAIVYPVNEKMRLYSEEQFGPVIPVMSFRDLEEAILYVVNSNFGQQLSIFSKSPTTIAYLIDTFANQVGRINLNAQCQRGPDTFPFTGRKDSAEGTLSVLDALRSFSIRTIVAAKENGENEKILGNIIQQGISGFLQGKD